ncbi:MAG: glycine zipper domain-containing protein [Beijerinckiaceae bacterium]
MRALGLDLARTGKFTAIAVAGTMALTACTDSQGRVAAGGALGAVAGGVIGYAVGGTRGAIVGAALGGITGLVLADQIEQQRAREAAIFAARQNALYTSSFRNSKGESVVVRSRPVRTYANSSGQRVRVVERKVTRNGQDAGTDNVELKEVKLANGSTEWSPE